MQGDLFSDVPTPSIEERTTVVKRPTIDQRFADFHAANPHVFDEMLRLARVHLANGATFISAKGLYEECRISLKTKRELGEYKLNNDYTAPMSRLLIEREPRLEGVIRLRRRKAA